MDERLHEVQHLFDMTVQGTVNAANVFLKHNASYIYMEKYIHAFNGRNDCSIGSVLARKIYMEGIVKQASDSRYWDFWSCQKLSSELELKRRHILKMNQVIWLVLIMILIHTHYFLVHDFCSISLCGRIASMLDVSKAVIKFASFC